jgi:regulator of sigma E protease
VERLDPGTIYSINAIPFGGFAKMLGEEDPTFPGSLASKGKLARIAVLSAGAAMNLLTAVLFFAAALSLGAPVAADPQNAVIQEVLPGSPAETVGLKAGDVVVRVDDTPVLKTQDMIDYVQGHLEQPVVLTVQRDGQTVTFTLVPRSKPPAGQGAIGVTLGPRTTIKRYPLGEALWMGAKQTGYLAFYTVSVPIQLIRGLIPADMARPVGPVGVGQIIGDAVQYSLNTGWWYPVAMMMGSLSVALAVTNLLPLPGLDGGRILFVIIEAIRGRRIDPAKEGLVHLIGMLLLVALMLFITMQDIIRPLPSINWGGF